MQARLYPPQALRLRPANLQASAPLSRSHQVNCEGASLAVSCQAAARNNDSHSAGRGSSYAREEETQTTHDASVHAAARPQPGCNHTCCHGYLFVAAQTLLFDVLPRWML